MILSRRSKLKAITQNKQIAMETTVCCRKNVIQTQNDGVTFRETSSRKTPHEIHSQYQKLEDQHQYRVPEDPRVLDPYADVGEIRIKAVQYGQSSQQLAALQYGRGVDHGAGNQAIEDLQAISNRGDLGAKEVAHNGLSLPQGRDVTKATQTYVDKDVEDTEEGHLQVGLAHLLPDHMKGR